MEHILQRFADWREWGRQQTVSFWLNTERSRHSHAYRGRQAYAVSLPNLSSLSVHQIQQRIGGLGAITLLVPQPEEGAQCDLEGGGVDCVGGDQRPSD